MADIPQSEPIDIHTTFSQEPEWAKDIYEPWFLPAYRVAKPIRLDSDTPNELAGISQITYFREDLRSESVRNGNLRFLLHNSGDESAVYAVLEHDVVDDNNQSLPNISVIEIFALGNVSDSRRSVGRRFPLMDVVYLSESEHQSRFWETGLTNQAVVFGMEEVNSHLDTIALPTTTERIAILEHEIGHRIRFMELPDEQGRFQSSKGRINDMEDAVKTHGSSVLPEPGTQEFANLQNDLKVFARNERDAWDIATDTRSGIMTNISPHHLEATREKYLGTYETRYKQICDRVGVHFVAGSTDNNGA